MSKAFVRKATLGDEEGIHNAHMQSIQKVCSNDYTSKQINAWGRRKFNYEAKKNLIINHHVWVVGANKKIEGYGLLFEDKEKTYLEIRALYLTPIVLRQGLGKKIIDQMKEMAKELEYKEIFLSSTKTSKEFYEKQGFHQYEEDNCINIGGVPIEVHPMKIEL